MKNINDYKIKEELITEDLFKQIKIFFKWLWSLTKTKHKPEAEVKPVGITGGYVRTLRDAGVVYDSRLENKIIELERKIKNQTNSDEIKNIEKSIQNLEETSPSADYSNISLDDKNVQRSLMCLDITKNINKVFSATNTTENLGFYKIYNIKKKLENNNSIAIKYFSLHLFETNLIFLCAIVKNYWKAKSSDNKKYNGYVHIFYESQKYFKSGTKQWLEYTLNFIINENIFDDINGYTIFVNKYDMAIADYLESELQFKIDYSYDTDNILLYKKINN